jgi:hypothetical protein
MTHYTRRSTRCLWSGHSCAVRGIMPASTGESSGAARTYADDVRAGMPIIGGVRGYRHAAAKAMKGKITLRTIVQTALLRSCLPRPLCSVF